MTRWGFFLFLLSCASSSDLRPYLFSRAKQEHEVIVYAKDGSESFHGLSIGVLSDEKAHFTILSPLGFTLLKVEMKQHAEPEIFYLAPALRTYKTQMQILLKKLKILFWLKQGEAMNNVTYKSFFEDGTIRELEWSLASQRIWIRIEKL